jgi:hypothetical protein
LRGSGVSRVLGGGALPVALLRELLEGVLDASVRDRSELIEIVPRDPGVYSRAMDGRIEDARCAPATEAARSP